MMDDRALRAVLQVTTGWPPTLAEVDRMRKLLIAEDHGSDWREDIPDHEWARLVTAATTGRKTQRERRLCGEYDE